MVLLRTLIPPPLATAFRAGNHVVILKLLRRLVSVVAMVTILLTVSLQSQVASGVQLEQVERPSRSSSADSADLVATAQISGSNLGFMKLKLPHGGPSSPSKFRRLARAAPAARKPAYFPLAGQNRPALLHSVSAAASGTDSEAEPLVTPPQSSVGMTPVGKCSYKTPNVTVSDIIHADAHGLRAVPRQFRMQPKPAAISESGSESDSHHHELHDNAAAVARWRESLAATNSQYWTGDVNLKFKPNFTSPTRPESRFNRTHGADSAYPNAGRPSRDTTGADATSGYKSCVPLSTSPSDRLLRDHILGSRSCLRMDPALQYDPRAGRAEELQHCSPVTHRLGAYSPRIPLGNDAVWSNQGCLTTTPGAFCVSNLPCASDASPDPDATSHPSFDTSSGSKTSETPVGLSAAFSPWLPASRRPSSSHSTSTFGQLAGASPAPVLSLIWTYYEDEEYIVSKHLPFWLELVQTLTPDELSQVELVYVDDGSPKVPLRRVLANHWNPSLYPNLRVVLVELLVDVPWNLAGARNTGYAVSTGKLVMALDGDTLPEVLDVKDMLCRGNSDPEPFVAYARGVHSWDDPPGQPGPTSNLHWSTGEYNHFLATREVVLMAGGYNEDFATLFGGEDTLLKHCMKRLVDIEVSNHVLRRKPNNMPSLKDNLSSLSALMETRQAQKMLSRSMALTAVFESAYCNTKPVLRVPYRVSLLASGLEHPPKAVAGPVVVPASRAPQLHVASDPSGGSMSSLDAAPSAHRSKAPLPVGSLSWETVPRPTEFPDFSKRAETWGGVPGSPSSSLAVRCPAGQYLSPEDHAARSKQLRDYIRSLQSPASGFAVLGSESPSGIGWPSPYAPTSGHLIYESPSWPKPASCSIHARAAAGIKRPRTANVHTYRGFCVGDPAPSLLESPSLRQAFEKNGYACFNLIAGTSPSHPFVLGGTWKVGTRAWMNGVVSCPALDPRLVKPPDVGRLQAAATATLGATAASSSPGRLQVEAQGPEGHSRQARRVPHIMTARDPISRFASGFQEIFYRDLGVFGRLDWKFPAPGINQTTLHMPILDQAIRSGMPAGAPPPTAVLDAIVQAFVQDTVCAVAYPESQHVRSQASFVPPNFEPDFVLHSERKGKMYDDFFAAIGADAEIAAGGHLEQCRSRFAPGHSANEKPDDIPTKDQVLESLERQGLLKDLCRVYAQDYICFDYEPPAACKGMW